LEFAYVPRWDDQLADLAALAEPEDWEYHRSASPRPCPILSNYLRYTYVRLAEEDKIAVTSDEAWACLNTGLVTPSQEAIFMLFDKNTNPDQQYWHFVRFCRRGEWHLNRFDSLPDMAHYFDDPSKLVFDCRKDLRVNIDHVITDNKVRFPAPYNAMDDYQLQTFLKGATDNARERVRRNYKAAIPQYYNGTIQLLLPLCIGSPTVADLALVVEDFGAFYRAATCLTLDMAYNNARQLARPDRDWLQP
jgi:hypothetical protein